MTLLLLLGLACSGPEVDTAVTDTCTPVDGIECGSLTIESCVRDGAARYELSNGQTFYCDDDCDGAQDRLMATCALECDDPPQWFDDDDGDGYGAAPGTPSCEKPIGTVATADDCDDDDASIHPGADEVDFDGIDQDCDGEDLDLLCSKTFTPDEPTCLTDTLQPGDYIEGTTGGGSDHYDAASYSTWGCGPGGDGSERIYAFAPPTDSVCTVRLDLQCTADIELRAVSNGGDACVTGPAECVQGSVSGDFIELVIETEGPGTFRDLVVACWRCSRVAARSRVG